jgi:hypothetical protein
MDYTDLDAALREIVGEAQVRADEPLAEHTTFRIGGAAQSIAGMAECEYINDARVMSIDLGTGSLRCRMELPGGLFYRYALARAGARVQRAGSRRGSCRGHAEAGRELRRRGSAAGRPRAGPGRGDECRGGRGGAGGEPCRLRVRQRHSGHRGRGRYHERRCLRGAVLRRRRAGAPTGMGAGLSPTCLPSKPHGATAEAA